MVYFNSLQTARRKFGSVYPISLTNGQNFATVLCGHILRNMRTMFTAAVFLLLFRCYNIYVNICFISNLFFALVMG